MTAATPLSHRAQPARATSNACGERNAFASGEASFVLPPVMRAALVRQHVEKVTAMKLAAARVMAAVAVETPQYADDAPDMMKCARCGTLQPERERCAICGEHR